MFVYAFPLAAACAGDTVALKLIGKIAEFIGRLYNF